MKNWKRIKQTWKLADILITAGGIIFVIKFMFFAFMYGLDREITYWEKLSNTLIVICVFGGMFLAGIVISSLVNILLTANVEIIPNEDKEEE